MTKTKLVILAVISLLLPLVIGFSWYNTIRWHEPLQTADLVTGMFSIIVFLGTGIWAIRTLCKGNYHAT